MTSTESMASESLESSSSSAREKFTSVPLQGRYLESLKRTSANLADVIKACEARIQSLDNRELDLEKSNAELVQKEADLTRVCDIMKREFASHVQFEQSLKETRDKLEGLEQEILDHENACRDLCLENKRVQLNCAELQHQLDLTRKARKDLEWQIKRGADVRSGLFSDLSSLVGQFLGNDCTFSTSLSIVDPAGRPPRPSTSQSH